MQIFRVRCTIRTARVQATILQFRNVLMCRFNINNLKNTITWVRCETSQKHHMYALSVLRMVKKGEYFRIWNPRKRGIGGQVLLVGNIIKNII